MVRLHHHNEALDCSIITHRVTKGPQSKPGGKPPQFDGEGVDSSQNCRGSLRTELLLVHQEALARFAFRLTGWITGAEAE
jgi:hypothetical protein